MGARALVGRRRDRRRDGVAQPRGLRRVDRHARARPLDRIRRPSGRRLPPDHALRGDRRLHEPARSVRRRRPVPDHDEGERRMKWVTRARPKTDRIACPWLIRRFIDPDAEILYVPTDQVLAVAEREGAHGFDTPGAEYDHRDGRCTFEVLIEDYDLGGDAAL